ncbi:SDR family oxidoreductase [Micromonospora sp. NPDC005367]|uniref:SDR family oxidoreductase n=1 Tax=Micromonospora sp. NPDC005367 TaxID=3155590 RepID=UPI0033AD4221
MVNVPTMVAEFGGPGFGLYGSSKAALVLLTRSWVAEYGSHGVRVDAVSPAGRPDGTGTCISPEGRREGGGHERRHAVLDR